MYGCSTVKNITQKNWIAVLERGQCSFLQKVQAMQESGAIAVVVGDRHFNGWVTMYAPGIVKRAMLLVFILIVNR
jgi:E3 ubiquitin-protein ligase RNF13